MIAKGNKDDMEKLKELKNEFFHNTELKNIIEEYRALREGLIHDDDEQQLRTVLIRLQNNINGGMVLEGYGACDLCPPRP
jgi:hypothetical protein